MSETKWRQTAKTDPSFEELTARVSERIRFLEDELREKFGLYLTMGAELEWHVQRKTGIPHSEVKSEYFPKLEEYLRANGVPYFESIVNEQGKGKYEIMLGNAQNETLSAHPSEEIALQIENAKTALLTRLPADHPNIQKISFEAVPDFSSRQTAGLHINMSAVDSDGTDRKNLFYSNTTEKPNA